MEKRFSPYLSKIKPTLKLLLDELLKLFPYASILAVDVKGKRFTVNTRTVSIADSRTSERGFVVRVNTRNNYCEYSFNNINEDNYNEILLHIVKQTRMIEIIGDKKEVDLTDLPLINEEVINKSFYRDTLKVGLSTKEIIEKLNELKDEIHNHSNMVVNAIANLELTEVSKMFLSSNKDLEQYYNWGDGVILAATSSDKGVKYNFSSESGCSLEEILTKLKEKTPELVDVASKLHRARPVKPGTYDVICSPEVTGLIAHEAFGHGVEMDMFVKNRAKAIEYLNKEVASNKVNMYDGANVFEQVSSYFFDDEGTLAQNTQIIDNGILKNGINDVLTAMRLNVLPTGNGKRESFERKAYTRMTNTYFAPGDDKLEDMIKSIKHGYFLVGSLSGMEDPKNWGIQCIASYGIEIINGKLTSNWIAPVLITGYVPDLLKSITMVSDDLEMFGSGYCGKGYKEFVKVSDGGPYLKARVRLG
jgi:TldD protein